MKFFKPFITAFLLFASLSVFSEENVKPLEIPNFTSPVINKTNIKFDVLKVSTAIEELSKENVKIAIIILDSTKPETIEQYSIRAAEKWKVGEKGKDNGVILTIATLDRKARIEVGYGLEGVLTDAISTRILNEYATPFFKENNFEMGIIQALGKIKIVVSGGKIEETIKMPQAKIEQPKKSTSVDPEMAIFLLLAAGVVSLFTTHTGLAILGGIVGGTIINVGLKNKPTWAKSIFGSTFITSIAAMFIPTNLLFPLFVSTAIFSAINILMVLWFILELLSNMKGGGGSYSGGSGGGFKGGGGGRFGGGGGSSSW